MKGVTVTISGTRGSIFDPKYENKHEALHQERLRKCKSGMVSLALDAWKDMERDDCVASGKL